MIKSIKHKGLSLYWKKGDISKLPGESVHKVKKIMNIIDYLEKVPQDFYSFKNLRPHPLKGGLKGFWSLDLTANWRIIFRFENGHAYDVNMKDTH